MSTISWLPTLVAELRVLGELSFMSEAGVAGDAIPGRGGCRELGIALFCGAIQGDGFADRDFGSGGGGISTGAGSFRASGDTEQSSESVTPFADEEEVCIMGVGSRSWSCSTLSASSLSTCAFKLGVVWVLLRMGFEIGDCLMPDLALAFAAFFRIFLARSPGIIF